MRGVQTAPLQFYNQHYSTDQTPTSEIVPCHASPRLDGRLSQLGSLFPRPSPLRFPAASRSRRALGGLPRAPPVSTAPAGGERLPELLSPRPSPAAARRGSPTTRPVLEMPPGPESQW